jgi:hypothetical protein
MGWLPLLICLAAVEPDAGAPDAAPVRPIENHAATKPAAPSAAPPVELQTVPQPAPKSAPPIPSAAPPPPATKPAAAPPPVENAPPRRSQAIGPEKPSVEQQRPQKQNPRVPLPFSKNTTNPSLDAGRSTTLPDREALPESLKDALIAPYGPAPPDVTPTDYGGGPRRVQPIHAPPAAATPPAAPAPDPRRTP